MKKKAVAVIYSPKTLLDFLWYYASYGEEYKWDVIVVTYGKDVKKIQSYLKKAQIFDRIVIDADNDVLQPMGKKICIFIQMLYYFMKKEQNIFCKKYLNKRIDIQKYSLIVVPNTLMLLPCIFIGISDEYRTVILEDGTADYSEKKDRLDKRDIFQFWNLAGYFLAKMGYGNTTYSNYKLEKTRYCEKFATKPEKMRYRNFKSISKLNDMGVCDINVYREILERIYSVPNNIEDVDAVLFTYPFTDYMDNVTLVTAKIENYMNKNYKNSVIILKKHPRDTEEYHFDASIKIIEIDQTIPAEILLTYFKVKNYVFTWPSTILFSVDNSKCNTCIFYFKEIVTYNKNYRSVFKDTIQTLAISKKDIVPIA